MSHPLAPSPTDVTVHQASRMLEVGFDDGARFRIPFEAIAAVGHYAVQPRFSDGHDTGIFTWDYLYRLGSGQEELWARYESRLVQAGVDRDTPMGTRGTAGASGAAGGSCGHAH